MKETVWCSAQKKMKRLLTPSTEYRDSRATRLLEQDKEMFASLATPNAEKLFRDEEEDLLELEDLLGLQTTPLLLASLIEAGSMSGDWAGWLVCDFPIVSRYLCWVSAPARIFFSSHGVVEPLLDVMKSASMSVGIPEARKILLESKAPAFYLLLDSGFSEALDSDLVLETWRQGQGEKARFFLQHLDAHDRVELSAKAIRSKCGDFVLILIFQGVVSPLTLLPRVRFSVAKVSVIRLCVEKGLFGVAERLLAILGDDYDYVGLLRSVISAKASPPLTIKLLWLCRKCRDLGVLLYDTRRLDLILQALKFGMSSSGVKRLLARLTWHTPDMLEYTRSCVEGLLARPEHRAITLSAFMDVDDPLAIEIATEEGFAVPSVLQALRSKAYRCVKVLAHRGPVSLKERELYIIEAMRANGKSESADIGATLSSLIFKGVLTPYVISKALYFSDPTIQLLMVDEKLGEGEKYTDYDSDLLWAATHGEMDSCLELLKEPFPFDCLTEVAIECMRHPKEGLVVIRGILARQEVLMDTDLDFDLLLEHIDTTKESCNDMADIISLLADAAEEMAS